MRNSAIALLAVLEFLVSISLLASYVLLGVACLYYFEAAIVDPEVRWLYRPELERIILSACAVGALLSLRTFLREILLSNSTGRKAARATFRWRESKAILAVAIVVGSMAAMTIQSSAASLPVHRGFMDTKVMRWYALNDNGVWIENSKGGQVRAAYMLLNARRLVISGYCQSACAWAFVMHPNACYTRTARFAFHAAHRANGARDSWLTAKLANHVRKGLWDTARLTIYFSQLVHVDPVKWDRVYGDRKCGWS